LAASLGVALAAPCAVFAQQAVRTVGVLTPHREDPSYSAFPEMLRKLGYVEGRNLRLLVRSADWKQERLPGLARELLDARAEVVLRRYGLSTQTWGSWSLDVLKGYGVGLVVTLLMLYGVVGLARLSPHWWWSFGAVLGALLVVVVSFAYPVVVEPVFNKFTPMEPGPLRDSLVAMAARDGVPVKDVLVADASRRTTALNAYVSGIGPTRRIVVYDTLLREAPPGEVESVVAHELGHAKDSDVITGTLIGALGSAAAVCAVYLLGSWTGLLRRAGVESVTDPRSVALLLAMAAIAGLVAAPVQSVVSRRIEARADAHALALTNDAATAEAMERRLAQTNLADVDPNRFEYFMFASHPSTVERIAAARAFARGAR